MKDSTASQVERIGSTVFRDIPTISEITLRLVKPILLNLAAWLIQCVADEPIVDMPGDAPR